MNQSTIDVIMRTFGEVWEGLLSFGVVIAALYAVWLAFTAIYKVFE